MTSLAAWAAVDSRVTSSFYLTSDSRVSFGDGRPPFDRAQKLFVSSRYPDLFGYCGDVDFTSAALQHLLNLIDQDGLFLDGDDAEVRNFKMDEVLKRRFETCPTKREFMILHASRSGEGMKASFLLWKTAWSVKEGWVTQRLELPVESAIVLSEGSGGEVVLQHNKGWRHVLPGTSRSVFSAFWDALESGKDSKSGGPVQLVGLYQRGAGRHFGVIQKGKRFLMGSEIMDAEKCSQFEWRNKAFELCDFQTLERLPEAQRHPRPKDL